MLKQCHLKFNPLDSSCLTFSEIFASSEHHVSRLFKEVLSSVINNGIASRNLVEVVANTLQFFLLHWRCPYLKA